MVKKYKKKPVEVEAIQFTRDNFDEVLRFTEGKLNIIIEKHPQGKVYGTIDTLEGTMKATEEDYIIKGIDGEFYPCKPDIFENTYCQSDLIKSDIESKWISISDRFPDKDGEYLCCELGHNNSLKITTRNFSTDCENIDSTDMCLVKEGFYDYDRDYGYGIIDTVLYWMSLPKLPNIDTKE